MENNKKNLLQIAVFDFLFVFAVFIVSRIFLQGSFPRWYHLAFMSLLWALSGVLTRKLEFQNFATKKKALLTIVVVDVIVYFTFYGIRRLIFPERGIIASQFWPLLFILGMEILLYIAWYSLFRRVQYLYTGNIEQPYHESGIDKAVRYMDNESKNVDLVAIFEQIYKTNHENCCQWVWNHRQEFQAGTFVVKEGEAALLDSCTTSLDLVVCLQAYNDIRHFNGFLIKANEKLAEGGVLALYGETSGMRRSRILNEYPKSIAHVVAFFDYVWSRVFSKLPMTRPLYLKLMRGRHRNFPRVEVLGRMAKAGFDICGDEIHDGVYYVSAVKRRQPVLTPPYYGLMVRLPRKGENGKMIGVFKLRTMYAYSEYIQDYTYRISGLEEGGKIKDDFRVNLLGSFCRSRFLDELPMFINFFRGDLKLVGVRPLSKHYLSLYTPEMQQMHLSVKPGIFPPLYYDYPKPSTLEEIQESERRYIERYRQHPRYTDWVYFWGMMKNIVFRRERSH